MTDPLDLDKLLPRLRDRAADPDRRTSSRPSQLGAQMRSLDLGGLLSMGRSLADQLRGVVAANQAGTIDPAAHDAALDLERRMTTPAGSVLPAPADEATRSRRPRPVSACGCRTCSGASTPRWPTAASDPARGCCRCRSSSASSTSCARPGRCPRVERGPTGCCPSCRWIPAGTASRPRPGGSSRGIRRTSTSG